MNPTDPLAQLKDIHLPTAVAAWPPAIGWWLLVLILLLLVATGGYWWWRNYKNKAYQRESLAQLASIKANTAQMQPSEIASQISALLKQVAMTQQGRAHTAQLSGAEWLRFLDTTGKTQAFSSGAGQCLGDAIYQPDVQVDINQLFKLSENWIKQQS